MCILLGTVIFFSNRVINIWNALPDSIVKSPSVNTFKSKINSLHFRDFCADCAVRLYLKKKFRGRGKARAHVSAGFCLLVLVTPFASCFYILFMSLFSNFLFVFCDLVNLINFIWILYSAIKMGFFDKIDNVSGSNVFKMVLHWRSSKMFVTRASQCRAFNQNVLDC